jgi:methylmalonyl-CoA mutase cobalamin-binding subunit
VSGQQPGAGQPGDAGADDGDALQRLLRQAIAALPGGKRSPRILLTSVPDEQHVLGLLMAEGLFTLEGAECIPLGSQMPLLEIARAALAHQADVIALSFSSAFPKRQIAGLLQQLRQLVPQETAIWVGGAGVIGIAPMQGLELLAELEQAIGAIKAWQEGHCA